MRRMADGAGEAERKRLAAELRRVREAAREAAGDGTRVALPAPPSVSRPEPLPALAAAAPGTRAAPRRPEAAAVNALWEARPTREPAGLRGLLARLARRLLAPSHEAQAAFNARQVQLDNELLDYVDARSEGTHRHYDEVLGLHGRRMNEIDERHVLLSQELVAHVHDLVKRIDLVLSQAEGGRLSLEAALRDVRARLAQLEERLPRG